jgi:hypothetical protein
MIEEIIEKSKSPIVQAIVKKHIIDTEGNKQYYKLVGDRMQLISDFAANYATLANNKEHVDIAFNISMKQRLVEFPPETQLFESAITEIALSSF